MKNALSSLLLAALTLWLLSLAPLHAQTWSNTGTGDWFTAANWNPASVPTASEGALIDNGGTAQISTPGAAAEYVSLTSSGITLQNGGTLYASEFANLNGTVVVTGTGSTWGNGSDEIYIGQGSPAGTFSLYDGGTVDSRTTQTYTGEYGNGSILIDGAGSKWINSQIFDSDGTLTVQNGGTVAISSGGINLEGTTTITGAGSAINTGTIGITAGNTVLVEQGGAITSGPISAGVGTLAAQITVTDSGSNWTSTGTLTVTTGTITVQNGGLLSDTNCVFGDTGETNPTTAIVTGAGSQWNTTSNLMLGYSALGVLNITNGGHVTDVTANVFRSTATVDGTNSAWINTGTFTVEGLLYVQNGASVSDTTAVIAPQYSGTVTITGSGTTWQNSADIQVGDSAAATFSISSGATLTNVNGYIGYDSLDPASVIIDGAGSKWTNSSNLYVGYASSATGTLTIQNGSVVEVDGGTAGSGGGLTYVATGYSSYGTLQIGNGTAAGTLLTSGIQFGSGTGELIFDHFTVPYSFSPVLTGAGTILQEGLGTTILTGASTTFTGATSVTGGTLLVKGTLGSSASTLAASGGTIGGSGTIGGAITLDSGSILSPGGDGGSAHLTAKSVRWNGGAGMAFNLGTSSALLTLTGAFTKGSAGTYNFDFENAGGIAAGTTYNLVTYGSTTFTASNFTYTSSLAGFTGVFSISGSTLKFTVQTLSPLVAPAITSASTASFTLGQIGSFTVTATGNSTPTFSATGLPSWAFLNARTGVISGTPPNATGSPFAVALTASNGVTPNATETLTISVTQAPTLTSTTSATFQAGQANSFTLTATGAPTPAFSATGLPSWATLDPTTGVLSGNPPNADGSPFTLGVTASNGITPAATQTFTLTVLPIEATPAFTGSTVTTFAVGQPGEFIVTATGNPAPTFSATGLPSWATLNTTTGAITGTPPDATGAPFTIDLTASNGNSPNATQVLTMNVQSPIAFGSWETANNFTGTSTVTGPSDTPQNDAVPNLLKYLFDIDPAAAMLPTDHTALPVVGMLTSGETSYLTLTFRENPTQTLAIGVETSTDLQNWTPVTNPTMVQTGNDPTNGDPIMQAQVPATSATQFIRLNVTPP